MAEIEIQKKRGSAWIWWVIALVIVALLIWWVVAANNRHTAVGAGDVVATPTAAAVTPPDVTSPAATTTPSGAITDLSVLASATTAGDLVGRPVTLSNVPVAKAVSDKGFWVGNGNSSADNVFVVRGNQSASYTAPDGAVRANKRVVIFGTVMAMPANLTQQTTDWNLASTDREALAKRPVYIKADSVRLVP